MMAYVNVAEWNPDQVSEWLKGLDEAILPYVHHFVTNQVDGKRLLQLSADLLPALRVTKVGHQEIILQAIELLRNIHYHLNQENVQHLALRLSSKARSVCSELQYDALAVRTAEGSCGEGEEQMEEDKDSRKLMDSRKKQERVSTLVIGGVADVLSSVKVLVCWLNRRPFEGQEKYDDIKKFLVELSIRLATIAQRDKFAENQASLILQLCENLVSQSDKIIQESYDPLTIQPASLDIATVKKKPDDDWGLRFQSSYHGVHQVSGVIALSPAYQCGKLQEGDELVQVNYQTVIGWNHHRVTAVMEEFPVEVILTVKKRPRHANTVAQIYYLKPMPLPSKKKTCSPWVSVVSSPRYDIPNLQLSVSVDKVTIKQEAAKTEPTPVVNSSLPEATRNSQLPSSISDIPTTSSDHETEESDIDDDPFLLDVELPGSSPLSMRLYHPKPRVPVQRRATIPGATTRPTLSFDQLLEDVWRSCGTRDGVSEQSNTDIRPVGVDTRHNRPHTCIGAGTRTRLSTESKKHDNGQLNETDVTEDSNEDGIEQSVGSTPSLAEGSELGKSIINIIPLPPRKPSNLSQPTSPAVTQHHVSSDEKAFGGIRSAGGHSIKTSQSPPEHFEKSPTQNKDSHSRRVSEDRPKLDKSHSTPAYDMEGRVEQEGLASPLASVKPVTPSRSSVIQAGTQIQLAVGVNPGKVGPSSTHPAPAINSKVYTTTTTIITTTTTTTTCTTFTTTITASPCGTEGGKGGRNGEQSSSTQVMMRETRSSSPSIWRRAILVSDRGSRRISCRELGQGDHQGWLYRRRDNKGFLLPHRWERRWFILKKNYLYGYRDREAVRADSLIYLPGFHVCPATDVKAKKYAFKIYHSSGATFYFACDTSEERSRWMSQMGLSAITTHQQQQQQSSQQQSHHRHHFGSHKQEQYQQHQGEEVYYSETDEELEDRPPTSPHALHSPPSTKSTPNRDISGSSLWRGGSSNLGQTRDPPLCSSLGVLSVTKTPSLRFLQPYKDSMSQPVPTASFRSYRRINENSNYSTSTGDLRKVNKSDTTTDLERKSEESSGRQVTRKNSLRDRLRQLHTPFTLERRKPGANRGTQEIQKNRKKSVGEQQQANQSTQQKEFEKLHPSERISSASSSTIDIAHATTSTPTSITTDTIIITTSTSASSTNTITTINNNMSTATIYIDTMTTAISTPTTSSIVTTTPIVTETNRVPKINSLQITVSRQQSDTSGHQIGPQPRPHYMLPTHSRSQYKSSQPSSFDLEHQCGSNIYKTNMGYRSGTPSSSGKYNPTKFEVSERRGSVGGESSVRSISPRRGSLDCLAWPHPRALSPSNSTLHTPSRSSHGSASSLLASEEYREGSPEKLWINSLRTDTSKTKGITIRCFSGRKDGHSRSSSGENSASDFLKRTALYHPPNRGRSDPLKPAFELVLDPYSAVVKMDCQKENLRTPKSPSEYSPSNTEGHPLTITLTRKLQRQSPSSGGSTPLRPEVPPRTKFLSLSERTLSSTSSPISPPNRPSSGMPSTSFKHNVSSSPSSNFKKPVVSSPSFPSPNNSGFSPTTAFTRRIPNLTIRATSEETDPVRTPLKPAMGVSMIGKQRRTPTVQSPHDVFFSSPPSSPTLSSVPSSSISFHHSPNTSTPARLRNQKILPHYPGMEYPPVFEPGSYSLCGSPPDQTISSAENEQEGESECHSTLERNPIFTSSPSEMGHSGASHISQKFISSSESPNNVDQTYVVDSTREFHYTQRSLDVSCGNESRENSSFPSTMGSHHSINIIVTTQTTHQTLPSSSSPQTINVSSPSLGTTSPYNTTSPSSYSVASYHQNMYASTSVHSHSIQQNISLSPSPSTTPVNTSITGGPGNIVSNYTFGCQSPTNSLQELENQTLLSNKQQKSSRPLTPINLTLPTPKTCMDKVDSHRESSA